MGCACSRGARPTGFGSGAVAGTTTKRAAEPEAPPMVPYVHISPTGEVTEYGSRLEALSARIQFGGEIQPRQ